MELRQLRYFVAVAEELHFARAAARLLITSPSLSQQVRVLERDLRVRLFDRSSAGVALTPAGAQLLGLARETLARADHLEQAAQRLAEGRTAELCLGFGSFSLTPPARRLLAEFTRHEPELDLRLRQFEWQDPAAGLLDGSSEVALVRPPFSGIEALRTVELGRDALVAVMPEDCPLARRPSLSARRLAREPFLENPMVRDRIVAGYWYLGRLRGADAPATASRAATLEEWLAEVAMGRGVNIVPAGVVAEYRRPGLVFVPVDDLEPSSLVLAWDPRRVTAPAGRLVGLARRLALQPEAAPAS